MSWTTDKEILSKKQYQDDKNLEKRIAIHQYSICQQKWPDFLSENICFRSADSILDIGCGNARLWNLLLNNNQKFGKLFLSDISEGMLKTANQVMVELGIQDKVELKVADIIDLPYEDETFDVVIANHMLYHASDINKALTEVSRVLKDDGRLYATTIGHSHMKEVKGILDEFNPAFKFESAELASRFGLDNGVELINAYLGFGECIRYEDYLLVPEPTPIVDWICSMDNDRILDKNKLENYLSSNFDFTKGLRITKETGLIKGIKKSKGTDKR